MQSYFQHVTLPAHVGVTRRRAKAMAADLGLSEALQSDLAVVVTELGTNLVRHAGGGELIVSPCEHPAAVDVISIDEGPGLPPQAWQDGWSSKDSTGIGLGAVQRLATQVSSRDLPGGGTVIAARVQDALHAPQRPYCLQHLQLPAHGEYVCGDSFGVDDGPQRLRLVLLDGLGHGPHARHASQIGCAAALRCPGGPAAALWQAHDHIHRSAGRGAVGAVADIDPTGRLTVAIVGNIAVRTLGDHDLKGYAERPGTLGRLTGRPREYSHHLQPGDLLLMHSDGISHRWTGNLSRWGRPGNLLGAMLRDYRSATDDITALALQWQPAG